MQLRLKLDVAQGDVDAEGARVSEIQDTLKEKEKEKAVVSRKQIELERKGTALQKEIDGKNPDAIRLREEIAHTEKRKRMSEKSLEKVKEQQEKSEEVLTGFQVRALCMHTRCLRARLPNKHSHIPPSLACRVRAVRPR